MRRPRPLPEVVLAALVALGVVVWGTLARAADPTAFGVATPPFVMSFGVDLHPLAVVSVLVAILAVPLAGLLVGRDAPAWQVLLGVTLLGLGLGLAVNLAREGLGGWTSIFDAGPGGSFEAKNEYLPGLGALDYGAGFFLDRFAELNPSLPVNVAGHPPLLLLLADGLALDTTNRFAALCIAGMALVAPGTYVLARVLGLEERRARLAGVLAALSPVLLLYGVTSADAPMAAAGTWTAAALCSRRRGWQAVGIVGFLLCSLLSWALLAVGAFAAVAVWRRDGWRVALALAVACGAMLVTGQGLLAAATGYDPIGTLLATEAYYRNSVAAVRPYSFWVLGSTVAFALMLGPVIAGGAVAALRRGAPAALGLLVVIAVASLAGFTKAETERIWLPFVGWACVAAAHVLPPQRTRLIAATLALQALVLGAVAYTVW